MAENRINITVTASGAAEAQKVLAAIAKEGASIGSIVSPAIKKADDALNDFGGTAKRVFEIFTGINLATVFQQATVAIRDFVVESSKLGREQQLQEATFKSFATSVGVAGDALAAEIEKVAGGIIDSGDAMKIAMRGLSEGLQPQQIVTLTDAARQLAKSIGVDAVEAYQDLTEAITTGQSRRLKEIGITIDQEQALKLYAASLGTTVEQLSTAGKAQALFNAVMEKAGPIIESNRQVNDEFGESMQRLRVAWQDVHEIAGVFINDTALAILKWLTQVKEDVGDLGPRLTELGTIWVTTWTNAAAALAPLAGADGGLFQLKTLINNVSLALGESAAIINMQILIFTKWTGAIQFVALALKDLASGQLPDLAAHTATVTKRVEDAAKAYELSQASLQRLVTGFGQTKGAVDDLGPAVAMGANAFGSMSNQVKALVPDLKALAAEAAKVADAILKGHVAAAESTIAETERALALELALTNKLLADEAKLLEQGTAGWIAHAEAIEQSDLAGLAAELAITNGLLAEEKKALDDTNAGWVAHAEAILAGTEANLNAVAKTNEPLRAYHDTLERINLQAKLFGPSFDALPPTIAAVTAEILRLAEAGQDVTALQEKLAGLKQVQELKGIFADVFSSIGSAISTSIQGVILGTQTMAQAWDKLWKSIVLSFLNSGIQRVLKGLQDWALDFFFGKSSGGSGGGGGGFIGALFGGGSSGRSLAEQAGGAPLAGGVLSPGAFGQGADALGGFTKALDFATSGTSSFTSSLLNVQAIGAGLWGAVGGAGGALGPAFTGVGAVDVAIAGGSLMDIGSAASAAIGPITSMNVAFAGVAAAMAVFGTVMDFVNGKTEAAIGGLVGGVAGAVGGGILGSIFLGPGLGTIFGALAGGAIGDFLGSLIGGLFGGPSNYELKRAKAADEASAFVGGTGQGYQAALNSGSLAQILAALQSIGTGANPLRTELVLTSTVAEQLGVKGEREGDNVIIQWAQVTEQQLGELIALFKASPEMVPGAIRGGGDIAYLTPEKVKPYAEALEQGAESLLAAFSALDAVKDKINALANDLTEAAKEALPPGLAQEFADGIVNPIRDRMLAIVSSGLPAAEMQKQLDAMTVELQGKVEAWNMFAVAIKQATVVDALIPANLHTQFRAAMEPAYDAMLDAMRTGTAAQAKLQADHFAKLTQGWAAFSDAVEAQVGVEMLLEPIADLGERFSAAMQPIYDKILASLVAGNGAIALAQTQTFARLTQAWATLGAATQQAIDVDALLPDDLGDRFRAKMQPEYDKILATLVAGNAEVAAALLTAFNKQLAAWASIGQTVTRITGELAGLTGTLDGSVETWVAVQRQMDTAVTRAQEAFDKALASGDVQRIATTAATLHDATMARLQAEMEMVKQIEAAITATLQAASGLVELVTTIAQMEIAMSGSIGTVQALLGALEGMATSGATVTQRMWAVQAAIETIIAVLPGLIEKTASFATALEWLTKGMQTAEQLRSGPAGAGAITGAIITGAAPFLAAQQAEIEAAKGAARLALLEQQAATLQKLAAAAVAGVNQWAQAAITGARAAADEVITGARAEADRRMDVARTEAARRQALIDAARDKALAAIDAEIEAAETAARLGQEARRAQIEALQELIAKSKEWESAVESMGKFIQSLKVGPLGPGNPMDKLMQAQDAFAKALQAYNANPTAGGLTDLQGLAQTMLGLAEPIFSKPSPQFQALSATTLKQLEAAQAVAAAQVTDSEVLQAQLDTLIAMDKAATLAAAAQLDALRANREAIVKDFEQQTKDLADALDKYLGETEAALKTYIDEVETALTTQTLAIEKAAKDEIDAINVGLIGALNANAFAQAGLVGEQNEKIDTLIEALTSTEYEGVRLGDIAVYAARRQDDAILILGAIKRGIELAVGQPLARGSERVTEGLYHLHDDEAVLPRALAERFRAAGGFDQMIRSAAEGAGITDPYGDLQYDPTGRYKPSLGNLAPKFVFTGPQAEALNQLQGIIEMLEGRLQADITGNTYKRFGKIYKRRTEAELEALKVRVGEQVAELHRQQQALIDSIPPPPVKPPTGKPPTGTPPPYIPPGPAWLTRGGDLGPNADERTGGGGPVGGQTTIIVKLDSKTIGEATLPTIHFDARGGKLRTIFLETRPK